MQVLSHGNVRHASETTAIRAVHRGERYRLRNFVSPCRAGRGCTPRSWVSPCRGGIRRKQRSSLSASREGRGCTPSSCFSPCRGGRGCTPRSSFSPCHGRTRRTPRSYLSASRVAALHFQCDKRECENGHSARVYRLIAAPRRCGGWREISDNDKIAFAATMNKTKIFTTIESLPNALGAPRFTPSRRGLQCRFASALRGSGASEFRHTPLGRCPRSPASPRWCPQITVKDPPFRAVEMPHPRSRFRVRQAGSRGTRVSHQGR